MKSPGKSKRSGKTQRIGAKPAKALVQTGPARNQLLWLGLILLATFAAYLPVLRGSFTNYDDVLYIPRIPWFATWTGAI